MVRCSKARIGLLVRPSAASYIRDAHRLVFTIDAIDNIGTKVDLLHYCHSHNIKVSQRQWFGFPRLT